MESSFEEAARMGAPLWNRLLWSLLGGGLMGQDQAYRRSGQAASPVEKCVTGPLTLLQKWLVYMRCQTWWDDTSLNCKKKKETHKKAAKLQSYVSSIKAVYSVNQQGVMRRAESSAIRVFDRTVSLKWRLNGHEGISSFLSRPEAVTPSLTAYLHISFVLLRWPNLSRWFNSFVTKNKWPAISVRSSESH